MVAKTGDIVNRFILIAKAHVFRQPCGEALFAYKISRHMGVAGQCSLERSVGLATRPVLAPSGTVVRISDEDTKV